MIFDDETGLQRTEKLKTPVSRLYFVTPSSLHLADESGSLSQRTGPESQDEIAE